nr:MAG TPA: hypothetical protein [Bacteriophage sp.]
MNMKDSYHIELTDDSASLNRVNDPLCDALLYARENNQEHKNVPIFVLPTTMYTMKDKFIAYSSIGRILTKETLENIVDSINNHYRLEVTAGDCEVLKVIDTHLVLNQANDSITIGLESPTGEYRTAFVSFIRNLLVEIKARDTVFLESMFSIGVLNGGEGYETITRGVVIPKDTIVGGELNDYIESLIDRNEWESHPDYPIIVSKQSILPENDLRELFVTKKSIWTEDELKEMTEVDDKLIGKDTAFLLMSSYLSMGVDEIKTN